MKILVTGGSGFIGSHVVDRLLAEDAGSVTVFDNRIREENLTEALRTLANDGEMADAAKEMRRKQESEPGHAKAIEIIEQVAAAKVSSPV